MVIINDEKGWWTVIHVDGVALQLGPFKTAREACDAYGEYLREAKEEEE